MLPLKFTSVISANFGRITQCLGRKYVLEWYEKASELAMSVRQQALQLLGERDPKEMNGISEENILISDDVKEK